MATKPRIIEVVEISSPQSLIQREGRPTTELIYNHELEKELNQEFEALGAEIAKHFNQKSE